MYATAIPTNPRTYTKRSTERTLPQVKRFSKAVQRSKDRSQICQEQQQVAPKTLLPMVF